jgi:hypothetical protein
MAYERDVGKTAYGNVSYINVNNPSFYAWLYIFTAYLMIRPVPRNIMLNCKWLVNNQL